MINNSQKGVSLYLALMIMTVLLALALGISAILFGQIKMIRGMGNSVIAFYAADSGIEMILYLDEECRRSSPNCDTSICKADCTGLFDQAFPEEPLDLDTATYKAFVSGNGTIFKTVGNFKETNRAIEVTR